MNTKQGYGLIVIVGIVSMSILFYVRKNNLNFQQNSADYPTHFTTWQQNQTFQEYQFKMKVS
jgi:hypothetical protein